MLKRAVFALAVALCAMAQTPAPDGVVSPEVHPDRTVTFRIKAPKASEVTLYGDWIDIGKTQAMTKGSDGIWSATTAPLEANVHLYWFNLDGIAVADPVNPTIKLRQRTSASLVEVPATPAATWEFAKVPHGAVVTEFHTSDVLKRNERIIVYLPPGYEKGNTRYPIIYLNHGSGDVQESWTMVGHANLILDNLIAQGKAKPMIVVMPIGHATPFGQGRGGSGPSNNELFEQYLTKEVMPLVEGKYRVAPGRNNRALAGLSMGGGHTIFTGFSHPQMFGALGIFSSGPGQDFDKRFPNDPKIPLIWIACGDNDTTARYPRVKEWAESLNKRGINATFKTYQGAHTWPVWRVALTEFAPLLFKGGK